MTGTAFTLPDCFERLADGLAGQFGELVRRQLFKHDGGNTLGEPGRCIRCERAFDLVPGDLLLAPVGVDSDGGLGAFGAAFGADGVAAVCAGRWSGFDAVASGSGFWF